MSQENVEIVRLGLDAFNNRDRAAWLALCDPEYETLPSADWPETDPIRGPETAWDFYTEVDESWEAGTYSVDELIDAEDDRVVVHLRRDMRGKMSGAEVSYDYWLVFTLADRKVRRAQFFETRTQALDAVGLRE